MDEIKDIFPLQLCRIPPEQSLDGRSLVLYDSFFIYDCDRLGGVFNQGFVKIRLKPYFLLPLRMVAGELLYLLRAFFLSSANSFFARRSSTARMTCPGAEDF